MGQPKERGDGYQWELGWHVSAHQIARNLGQEAIFQLLMERTPADEKLLVACWLHDEEQVAGLLREQGDLAAKLSPSRRRQIAHAARNDDPVASAPPDVVGRPAGGRPQPAQRDGAALGRVSWQCRTGRNNPAPQSSAGMRRFGFQRDAIGLGDSDPVPARLA